MWRRGGILRALADCYAGAPGFVNDPDADHLRSRGPLPRGLYRLIVREHPRFARPAIWLSPFASNEMHGRSGFWLHGDNAKRDRSASTGCIVMGFHDREWIANRLRRNDGGDTLEVVSGV